MTRRRIFLAVLAVAGLFAVAPCRPGTFKRMPYPGQEAKWWPDWLYLPGWNTGGEWTDSAAQG